MLDASLSGDELALRNLHDLLLDADYPPGLVTAMIEGLRNLHGSANPVRGSPGYWDGAWAWVREQGIKEPVEFSGPAEGFPEYEEYLNQVERDELPLMWHEDEVRGIGPVHWWLERPLAEKLLAIYPGPQSRASLALPPLPEGLGWWLHFYEGVIRFQVARGEKYAGPMPPVRYVEFDGA
jgi:hypothetical protein